MTAQPESLLLVLNSGSSSLKAGVFTRDPDAALLGERAIFTAEVIGVGQGSGTMTARDGAGRELSRDTHTLANQSEALDAIARLLSEQQEGPLVPSGIGHRIVHGGAKLQDHVKLNATTLDTLRGSVHFAPLHLPASIQLAEQAATLFPDAPQAACFDTVFHRNMPEVAKRLAIPKRYAEAGIHRYGFHGLSYESIVAQLRAKPGALPERVIAAHLGSGSSLCAMLRGTSVDTTMSFTPCSGIPMATRTGDMDPGVLLFLARNESLSLDALEKLVNHESGLAGIADGVGDMQKLEAARNEARAEVRSPAQEEAALAFSIFATAVAKATASLIVSLGGLDLLVFTGGIGQHSATLRKEVLLLLAAYGLRLDEDANAVHAGTISALGSKAEVRILPAEEDVVIAQRSRQLLSLF